MRVVRFLLLVMGMAATVAGCAQQPVAYMVYPPAGAQYPAAGIDHVVYGTGGPYVPPRPAVAYAPPPNPALGSGPNLPPSPAYVAAPAAAAPAPGPAYTMAPAPAVAMAPQPAPPVAAPMAAPQMVAAPAPVASARPVRVASAVPVAAPVAVPAPPPATVAAPAQTALAAPAPVPAARPVRVASTVPIPVPIPPGPVAVPAGPVAYAPVVAPPDYTLDSGDRLRVVVFGQEGLTNAYLVDAAGCIDVPLIGQVLIHPTRVSQKPDRRSPGRRSYRAHVGAAELPDPAGRHRQRARALVLIGNPGGLQIALRGLARAENRTGFAGPVNA
jgi:Polysaccharide biosynthesis/export protein